MNSEEPQDQPKPSGLNFSLPQILPSKKVGLALTSQQIMWGIATLAALNLIVTIASRPGAPVKPVATPDGSLDAESLKKLALKMEQQGLTDAATGAWMEYLAAASPEPKEAADIWYRTGKLQQNAHAYEAALNAFYRAEALQPDSAIASDLGRRIEESLEATGRFAALRHELANRVALDQDAGKAGNEVVAEIGTEKITEAELDRRIEERIESELARFGARLPEAERAKRKEEMLARFSGRQERLQFLQQLLGEEMLYRKARQIELAQKPEVRRQLEETQRALLAGMVMQRRIEDYAKVTTDEVKARYEANKESFRIPETLQVSRVICDTADAAKARIAQGADGKDWEELSSPLAKGEPVPGLKRDAKLDALWAAKAKEVAAEPFPAEDGKFQVFLVRERTDSRIPAFEEIQDQVAAEVQRAKEEQVQGELLEQLRREFDVVLHLDRFQSSEEKAKKP